MLSVVPASGLGSGAAQSLHAITTTSPASSNNGFKAGKPFFFDGTRTRYQSWHIACTLYLRANSKDINTDEQQIVFMLSYMQGGHAGAWKDRYTLKNYKSGVMPPTAGQFDKDLDAAFQDRDLEKRALQSLALI